MKGRNGGTLEPWQPGQSGNPAGSSKAQRFRMLLMDSIAEGMGAEIPGDLEELLKGTLARMHPKADAAVLAEFARKLAEQYRGLRVAEALASDVILRALAGSLDDLRLIVQMEPAELKMSGQPETPPRSAEFVPTEEETREWLEMDRDAKQVY